MTQHTPLFIAFAVALSAVVGGALLFENDDVSEPENTPLEGERRGAEGSRDPFIQEYQELEKLLEETRAQREMRAAKQRRAQIEQAELTAQSEETLEKVPVVEVPVEEPVLVEQPQDSEQLTAPPEVVVESPAPSKPEPSRIAAELIKQQPQTRVEPQQVKSQQIEPKAVVSSTEPQPRVVTKIQPEKTLPTAVKPQQAPPKEMLKKRTKVEVQPKQPPKKVAKRSVGKQVTKRPANTRLSQKHVQVGAFTSKARANAIAKDLQESNFNLEVVSVRQGGKRYYLLRDYSAKTRKEALRLKDVYDGWLKVDSLVRY